MWDKRPDMLVHEDEPYNAEPPVSALAEDLTPLEAFYSRNHGPAPDLDPAAWRLEIGGDVDEPLVLSRDDLRSGFTHHEVVATLQCAGNRRAGFLEVADIPGEDPWESGAVGTATWGGVRLGDLLDAAGARADADLHVAFSAPDVSQIATPPQAYGSSIPLSKARTPDVLVALEMNGRPLSRIHGAPARVVVPGYIGARSVKWVERIEVQPEPSANYFQATAYRILRPGADPTQAGPGDGISLGPWSLNCAITSPEHGTRPGPGPLAVRGYAIAAEGRDVARIDVSADEGRSWTAARLLDRAGPWAWQRWEATLDVTDQTHGVIARAWDDTGAQQPRQAADLWNPKGYANTSWTRVGLLDPEVR